MWLTFITLLEWDVNVWYIIESIKQEHDLLYKLVCKVFCWSEAKTLSCQFIVLHTCNTIQDTTPDKNTDKMILQNLNLSFSDVYEIKYLRTDKWGNIVNKLWLQLGR